MSVWELEDVLDEARSEFVVNSYHYCCDDKVRCQGTQCQEDKIQTCSPFSSAQWETQGSSGVLMLTNMICDTEKQNMCQLATTPDGCLGNFLDESRC